MDHVGLGLRIGIEIHRQLLTGKLFCRCPSELTDEVSGTLHRTLSLVRSEKGDTDPAAEAEHESGARFRYEMTPSSCLVEVDEEPPGPIDKQALDIALTVSMLLGSNIRDMITFMRKIVLDGSMTSGFQRTAIVAMEGELDLGSTTVPIESICLEEDAARRMGEHEGMVVYRLDRQGIPLVEISTAPAISDPTAAMEAAIHIGEVLKATGAVQRGIGSIRQDVNVSIDGGARVEIKGVQDVKRIPELIEREAIRQLTLMATVDILGQRLAHLPEEQREPGPVLEVTDLMTGTTSKQVLQAMKQGGVYAMLLPGFRGLLRSAREPRPDVPEVYRGEKVVFNLGGDLGNIARRSGITGVFHTDELPAYGILQEDVDRLGAFFTRGIDDVIVFAAGPADQVVEALGNIRDRAFQAFRGVPGEVRRARNDGETDLLRPLSGPSRMYPETDVPNIRVDPERLARLERDLPELIEEKVRRFQKDHGISRTAAESLIARELHDVFERLVEETGDPKLSVMALLNVVSELSAEGEGLDQMAQEPLVELLGDAISAVTAGKLAKEGMWDLVRYLVRGIDVDDAIRELGIQTMGAEELERRVRTLMGEHMDIVEEFREDAQGQFMGIVMSDVRGRVDGRVVNSVVARVLQEVVKTLPDPSPDTEEDAVNDPEASEVVGDTDGDVDQPMDEVTGEGTEDKGKGGD